MIRKQVIRIVVLNPELSLKIYRKIGYVLSVGSAKATLNLWNELRVKS